MSLNRLKQAMVAYCTTQGGELPAEYQKVDKIRGAVKTAYINTGVPYNNVNMRTVIDVGFVSGTGNMIYTIWGVRYLRGDTNNRFDDYALNYHGSNRFTRGVIGYATATVNNSFYNRVVIDLSKEKFSVNDVESAFDSSGFTRPNPSNYSASSTYSSGVYTKYNGDIYKCISAISTPEAWDETHWKKLSFSMYLNSRNLDDASDAGINAGAIVDWYGAKIYSNSSPSATIIRDYVPCYRKSDNKVGMYDKVNGEFYSSAGTVEFTIPSA